MEKLILKGVMWGADKIPDSVFNNVPGGYYKKKVEKAAHHQLAQHHQHRQRSRRRTPRRSRSEDGWDEDRRSDIEDDRSHRPQSQPSDARMSHDGPQDDYDEINHRPRRRRSRNMHADRSKGRHGHDHRDEYPRHSREDESRRHFPEPDDERDSYLAQSHQYPTSSSTDHDHYQQFSSTSPSSARPNNGLAGAYVPYANIYGQPMRTQANASSTAPPSLYTGSIQPSYKKQMTTPVARQTYQQNPYAQEALPGSQPSYLLDPHAQSQRSDPYAHDQYDDRHEPYARQSDQHPSRRRQSRRGRSRSRDDHDSDKSDEGSRSRSRRGHDSKLQGRGKSKIREAFDTSQRGLGYGAVGALAGGLVGSGVGKGAVSTALGATIGALGANAFEAKERKKHDQRQETWQHDGTYARSGKGSRQRRGSESDSRSD